MALAAGTPRRGRPASAFGLQSFPYFVAVDAAGKVVARSAGEISMADFAGLVKTASGQ